jgi:hypothetical protein
MNRFALWQSPLSLTPDDGIFDLAQRTRLSMMEDFVLQSVSGVIAIFMVAVKHERR